MRIAIDARIINSSTGRYVERLISHLEELDAPHEFIVLVLKKDRDYWKPRKPNFSVQIADFPSYSFAEQIGFAAFLYKLKPDLVHFCMPQQPLLYFGKRITTVHDLTLVRFENIDMNPIIYKIRKQIFTFLLKNVIRRSQVVLTPTEFIRQDVLDFTSHNFAEKVSVTLEGWDRLAEHATPVSALKGAPFLFFVGNAFPYKNLNRLVDAFALLQKKHPALHLALAGKKDIFYEQLAAYATHRGITKNFHILGYISEAEKRWMFQNAEAYVVASLSEGFHIPGLEAMSEDCPVISSDATCLPEVYAEAALYFDPYSVDALVEQIERILTDKKLRQQQIKAGQKRLKEFSWRRMARQTLDAYKRVLDV